MIKNHPMRNTRSAGNMITMAPNIISPIPNPFMIYIVKIIN